MVLNNSKTIQGNSFKHLAFNLFNKHPPESVRTKCKKFISFCTDVSESMVYCDSVRKHINKHAFKCYVSQFTLMGVPIIDKDHFAINVSKGICPNQLGQKYVHIHSSLYVLI